VETSSYTIIKLLTPDTAQQYQKKIVRYNFSLNNIIILYMLDVKFLLLCCRTPWLNKAPKVLLHLKVIMKYLLLQLDSLRTLDMRVLLDQESTFATILEAFIVILLAHKVLRFYKG